MHLSRIVVISRNARSSFLAKLGIGAALLSISDVFFFGYGGGSIIGVFALIWLAAVAWIQPAIRRARCGWVAIGAAASFGLILVIDPSFLGTILFLAAIGSVALLPGHVFDNAARWLVRLAVLALKGPFRAPSDLYRTGNLPGYRGTSAKTVLLHFALPLIGGGLFLALFASANPVLGDALSAIRLPDFGTMFLHAALWVFIVSLTWPTLRPRAIHFTSERQAVLGKLPDLPVVTMVLTLVTFNAIFAVENLLDIAFLWNGAALPEGVTLADYAHRGAYTLIATALLAGLFVLLALRPGSAAARDPLVRRLVIVWVAQNILLVASSVLRLFDYIDAYSLTVLRIAALAWMALVGVGLLIICWRFLAERTASWLINANALAAVIVLTLASIVDLGAVASAWNVSQLRDPARLDLCYLERQGSSALIPLIKLRDGPIGPEMRERAVYLSVSAFRDLRNQQADWQSWTLRNARRLAHVEPILAADDREPLPAPHGRSCGGKILPPPQSSALTDVPQARAPISGEPSGSVPEPLTPEEKR